MMAAPTGPTVAVLMSQQVRDELREQVSKLQGVIDRLERLIDTETATGTEAGGGGDEPGRRDRRAPH